MAAIQRYVNTASIGGDGTTNATSGANAAYASLSSWEANEQTDLVAAGDTHTVDCCGTAADTTACAVSGWTTGASNTITIRGNRSDANGFYTGTAVISTGHYRLDRGSATTGSTLGLASFFVTVDGIQIEHGPDGNYSALEGNANSATITKCRLRGTTTTTSTRAIAYDNSPGGSGTVTITNNLIVGFARSAIHINPSHAYSPTFNVYHNTMYGLPGEAASKGVVLDRGTGEPLTFNVRGNVFANWNGNDIVETGTAGTVTYDDNATEDYNLGTSGEIDLGATTDAWTSPGTTQASDFTVRNTSSSLYAAAAGALVSTDIADVARDGASYDVGCFEFVAAGGATIAVVAASFLAGGRVVLVPTLLSLAAVGASHLGKIVSVLTHRFVAVSVAALSALGAAMAVVNTGRVAVSAVAVMALGRRIAMGTRHRLAGFIANVARMMTR